MANALKIPTADIVRSALSLVDIGTVFQWKGRVFRAVDAKHRDEVIALFDSGLVSELVKRELLVKSWISDVSLGDDTLVIEHEAISVPTYPREWTFSMLKDAALLVLELNEVARRFGYQTKDCNGYNVLFHKGRPLYVDLCSFTPVASAEKSLLSYSEFLKAYLYPLQLWSDGGEQVGRWAVPRAFGRFILPSSYFRFRWPWLRYFREAKLNSAWKLVCSFRTIRHNDLSSMLDKYPAFIVAGLHSIKRLGLTTRAANIKVLRRRLRRIRYTRASSTWGDYHSTMYGDGLPLITPRFAAIVEQICDMMPTSVLEIAGNQGILCRWLRERLPQTRIICSDADGIALDRGYIQSRDLHEGIEWAVYDPIAPESSPLELTALNRYRSQVVVALALTHHLVLTHGMRIDDVFACLARHTTSIVITEFMPLGLHDGKTGETPPAWYTHDWFERAFIRHFEIIDSRQLEPNRVVFIGRIRKPEVDVR